MIIPANTLYGTSARQIANIQKRSTMCESEWEGENEKNYNNQIFIAI